MTLDQPLKWLVTGSNGNLGCRLVRVLLEGNHQVSALVRSQRAKDQLLESIGHHSRIESLSVFVCQQDDIAGIATAANGCDVAVHLVGILKATQQSSYVAAHESSCTTLIAGLEAAGVQHLSYLSILGSEPDSPNECLASKGRAERILNSGQVAVCTLRVPMVVGEGDYASFMLARRAANSLNVVFNADSLEQPIYAGDVVAAILAAAGKRLSGGFDLAGPESLSRRELYRRAASLAGNTSRTVSLPARLGYAIAGLLERILPNPPITRAMLEVLNHNDDIDPKFSLQALGLAEQTQVDTMLSKVIAKPRLG